MATKKVSYVGAPGVFALEEECKKINDAFGDYGCFLVGSALNSPNHRDVDVRFIMEDDEFHALFPGLSRSEIERGAAIWEFDPRWTLINTSISERMSRITRLPIDFQIHPMTWANARNDGPRHALGLRFTTDSK